MENTRNTKPEENTAPPFFRGSSIDGGNSQPPPQYECPICLHWLREPIITACGHRFCRDCISAWLKQRGHCPVDNVNLKDTDLFPDNFTKREILQQCIICPNSIHGCNINIGPLDLENHIKECKFKKVPLSDNEIKGNILCSFNALGCKTVLKDEEELAVHLESNIQGHLSLLMAGYCKLNIDSEVNSACSNAKEQEAELLWTPPDKSTNASNSQTQISSPSISDKSASLQGLVKALYERIVVLEQRNHEQDIAIGNLSRLITSISNSNRQIVDELYYKYCFGTLIWKIENFNGKLDVLLKDPTKILYSPGFYTSPTGYRFCVRFNCSPVQANCLALHIHVMKSDNDDCLNWPFTGKILLTLINPTFPQLSQIDTMVAQPELLAFQKPTSEMSTRGFGFTTYISVDDIRFKGFIFKDCLKIKIKIIPNYE